MTYTGCRWSQKKRCKNSNVRVGQLGLNSHIYPEKVFLELEKVSQTADLISLGLTWEGVARVQNSFLLSNVLRHMQMMPRNVYNLKVSSGESHKKADTLSSDGSSPPPPPPHACSAWVQLPTGASFGASANVSQSTWIGSVSSPDSYTGMPKCLRGHCR